MDRLSTAQGREQNPGFGQAPVREQAPGFGQVPVREQESARKACPSNENYERYIKETAENLLYPERGQKILEQSGKYNCDIKSKLDAIRFANQALQFSEDIYTNVVPPDDARKEQQRESGRYGGVGVILSSLDNVRLPNNTLVLGLKVEGFADASLAKRAGLKLGDVITHIKTEKTFSPVDGLGLDKTEDLLQGEIGKPVSMRILRNGKLTDISIARKEFEQSPVKRLDKESGIAYFHIRTWHQHGTAEALKKAIERGPQPKGIIFDLRGNGGGFADEARNAISLVVSQGEILKVRERMPSDPKNPKFVTDTFFLSHSNAQMTTDRQNSGVSTSYSPRFPDIVNQPLVILTDRGTASASEIFTAALKDNGQAITMGETTFGKGIGQTIYMGFIGGERLRVTNFEFLRPNGQWIGDGQKNKRGIEPTISVQNNSAYSRGSERDLVFQEAKNYLKLQIKTGSLPAR